MNASAAPSMRSRGLPLPMASEIWAMTNSISRSTMTAYSPSLPPKCSYTIGLEIFARSAISSTEVPS